MIGASRSALFARDRHVASSWQRRHHGLSPSRQRRLAGNSLAGFSCPQWRQTFIRLAALLILTLGPQFFESVFREILARGVTSSGRRWLTAPLPVHGSRGTTSPSSRARTCRRLLQAERCDEPRADRLSRNAGTASRLAFSPPLSSAASARSYGHGVPSNGAGRRLGRRDRSGHEPPCWGRSACCSARRT